MRTIIKMKIKIIRFLCTLTLFIAIDFLWFKLSGSFFYRMLEPLAKTHNGAFDMNYTSALGVYLLLAIGLHFLVLASYDGNKRKALLKGAVFGLTSYGIYDLTNHATLKHWPLEMILVDMSWGIFSCTLVTFLVLKFKMLKIK